MNWWSLRKAVLYAQAWKQVCAWVKELALQLAQHERIVGEEWLLLEEEEEVEEEVVVAVELLVQALVWEGKPVQVPGVKLEAEVEAEAEVVLGIE